MKRRHHHLVVFLTPFFSTNIISKRGEGGALPVGKGTATGHQKSFVHSRPGMCTKRLFLILFREQLNALFALLFTIELEHKSAGFQKKIIL